MAPPMADPERYESFQRQDPASVFEHLPILVKHRLRLKFRDSFAVACEFICMGVIFVGLVMIQFAATIEFVPANNYAEIQEVRSNDPKDLVEVLNGAFRSKPDVPPLEWQYANWSQPIYVPPSSIFATYKNNTAAARELYPYGWCHKGNLTFAPSGDKGITALVNWLKNPASGQDVWFNQCHDPDHYLFATEEEAEKYVVKHAPATTWALIVGESLDGIDGVYEYKIRMNRTHRGWNYAGSTMQVINQFIVGRDDSFRHYYKSGWLTLQNVIDQFIIQSAQPTQDPKITWQEMQTCGVPYPIADYEMNWFLQSSHGFLGFLFSLAFIYPLSRVVRGLVEEKFSRIREGMYIMGLNPLANTISWIIVSYLILFVQGAIGAALLLFLYKKTLYLVLLILIELYLMASVAFCFFLATLFSKPRTAAVGTLLILFICSMVPTFLTDYGGVVQIPVSILPSAALVIVSQTVSNWESVQIGVSFKNVGDGEFPVSGAYGMLLFDIFLYHMLAWYISNVFPGEYGVPRRAWFFLLPSYWCPKSADNTTVPERMRAASAIPVDKQDLFQSVEDEERGMERIQLQALRKVYPDGNVAVKGMNLAMAEDRITVLLGHNGAGKTTTIHMMTGMIPPTGGDCSIYGNSIKTNLESVRNSVGFCPQHNILWDNVSVEEHLHLFARLKGVPADRVKVEVYDMIEAIGLQEKTKVQSKALSGGMKRRLSVGMALIGGSKMVFLDEPTAGMDPTARRQTWDILSKLKKGRCVMLTTHFMDEADILGDKIAIMAKGQLECCGTSLFLKSRLGVGYNLAFSTTQNCRHQKIINVVKKHVVAAEVQSSNGMELQLLLPMAGVKGFPDLFRELESREKELEFNSFGLSLTTLEEVFTKIALDKEGVVHTDEDDTSPTDAAAGKPDEELSESDLLLPKKAASYGAHGKHHSFANSLTDEIDVSVGNKGVSQFVGLLQKRFHYGRRDKTFLGCLTILPALCIILGMGLGRLPYPNPDLQLEPHLFVQADRKHTPTTITVGNMGTQMDWYTGDDVDVNRISNSSAENSVQYSAWLLSEINAHGNRSRYGGAVINDVVAKFGPNNQTVRMDTAMHNSTSGHALPTFLSSVNTARLRSKAINKQARIVVHNHPLPFSEYTQRQISQYRDMFTAIFILVPYSFLPANFVSFLVRERATKAKHLQVVSGVNIFIYWGVSYLWDLAVFMVTIVLTVIIYFAFDKQAYVGDASSVFGTFFVYLSYAVAILPTCYCFHFLFSSPAAAQLILMTANFVFGVALVVGSQIMKFLPSTAAANDKLVYVYRLVPSFALGEAVMNIANRGVMGTFADTGKYPSMWTWECIGTSLMYLWLQAPFFFLVTFMIELGWTKIVKGLLKAGGGISQYEAYESSESVQEDPDVIEERKEIENNDPSRKHDLVRVKRLRKVYPPTGKAGPKVAVHDLSFGVQENEIFALLGSNGAGKTTTMSILSGEFPATQGEAVLAGYDISTEMRQAQTKLGYCPQFDALLDLLTVREHLTLYSRLRGVRSACIAEGVRETAQQAGLTPFMDRIAKKLSGGNRRKLSMAISVIGGPKVIFLDEPTAGMDPVARRSTWSTIQAIALSRSLILTTHHMEEVEALASRVAIMVHGRLMAIGSLQHLKSKYGSGYNMEFRFDSHNRDKIVQFAETSFIGIGIIAEKPGWIKFKMDINTETVKLSEIFETVEKNRDIGIIDYSVSQPTLEQVFLQIAAAAEHDRDTSGHGGAGGRGDADGGGGGTTSAGHHNSGVFSSFNAPPPTTPFTREDEKDIENP